LSPISCCSLQVCTVYLSECVKRRDTWGVAAAAHRGGGVGAGGWGGRSGKVGAPAITCQQYHKQHVP
jgi:hypothetical protein